MNDFCCTCILVLKLAKNYYYTGTIHTRTFRDSYEGNLESVVFITQLL